MFDSLIQSIESGFSDLMPHQFCLPCFLKGLATGLVIGIAAIALLPEELFVAALVLGVIGLAKMAADWKNMNDAQKSEALGNLVGGALAGGAGKGGFEFPMPRPMVTPEGVIAWDTAMVAVGGTGQAAAAGAIGGSGTSAMMSGEGSGGGGNDEGEQPRFKGSPKHGPEDRGRASRGPKDGQAALDDSVQVKNTSPRRVGVDEANDEIVVLDQTSPGEYHGHARSWDQLTDQQRNALIDSGRADKKGNIVPRSDR